MPATVRDVLASSGLEPERLVLELSERALARRLRGRAQRAARAWACGSRSTTSGPAAGRCTCCASGQADIVKIARPFVDGAGRPGHDRAVLSMVVQVASMFGVQVVAQGIEREDQREALAALGCELGQGYLLGRPLPLARRRRARPTDFLSASRYRGAP